MTHHLNNFLVTSPS